MNSIGSIIRNTQRVPNILLRWAAISAMPWLFVALLLLADAQISNAESFPGRTFNCNGSRQDRPCSVRVGDGSMSLFHPRLSSNKGPSNFAAIRSAEVRAQMKRRAPYARIVSQHYEGSYFRGGSRSASAQVSGIAASGAIQQEVGTAEGRWFGVVEGHGNVHLFLELTKDAELLERRFMGKINLVNKSTTYSFVSALPKVRGWSWKVIAEAA